MAFNRPTLSELIERIQNDFESRLSTAGAVLRRSIVKVLSRVIAGASHLLHGHLDFITKQVFPDTANSNYLDRWSSIWNVPRNPAEFADGIYVATGTDGIEIPEDTLLKRSDDVQYTVTATATIAGGTADVSVQAVEAGEDGNCDADTELTLVSPIAGIDTTGTVDEDGISGGTDEESDDDLRTRLLYRIQNPPMGGAENDYIIWAREVAGVTRVWCYQEWLGPGTVGVTFVRDDDDDIIPSAGEVEDVQDHIDENRPVTAHVTVFAPIEDPIAFTIQITPETDEVKAVVEAELADMIYRDGEPGGTILLSRMHEAISIAAGETDNVLVSPVADHVSGDGELPTMGTVTWA